LSSCSKNGAAYFEPQGIVLKIYLGRPISQGGAGIERLLVSGEFRITFCIPGLPPLDILIIPDDLSLALKPNDAIPVGITVRGGLVDDR